MKHDESFVEPRPLVYQPPTNPGGSERACVIPFQGLTLRKLSTNEMKFDARGDYYQSWVVLPNYQANGLQFLYGFEVQRTTDGTVEFQLSNDNGVTWYYYDDVQQYITNPSPPPALIPDPAWSPGWKVAGSTDWNTIAQVDLNVSTFPITLEKQVRMKIRLTPGAGDTRPIVHGISFYVHLEYDFQDDVLRSLKHHLEQKIRLKTKWVNEINDTDKVSYTDSKWEHLLTPITAYNLDTDPNKTTNLFSRIVNDRMIELTSRQHGRIESALTVQPEVFIAAEDFVEMSVIPSVVVTLASVRERRDLRDGNGEYDIALERRMARYGYAKVHFDADVRVSCQSATKHEVIAMSEAVDRAMTHDNTVLSEATGETMGIPSATPFTVADRVAQGLFAKDYSAVIFGKAWLRNDAIKDLKIATTLVVSVGVGSTEAEVEVE